MTDTLDLDHLRQWIGRTEEKTDVVTAHLVAGLRSTLFQDIGQPKAGDAAPFTTHWCLTLPVSPLSGNGPDGHPKRGGFLPPVPLPRRMWAGGEIHFIESLRVFSHLANVGDAKSLVIHPATTTHYRMDDSALRAAGITEGTVRLSVGLESADDLVEDLGRALYASQKA